MSDQRKVWLGLPYVSSLPDAYAADAQALRRDTGANFGNDVFRHALKSILSGIDTYTRLSFRDFEPAPPAEIIVLSCANWIGTSDNHERSNLARLRQLERSEAPIVPFGLGVQAPHGARDLAFGPGTRALVALLSARAESISVRDAFTRETLGHMGADNVIVTGCPSNFINLRPDLGRSIAAKAAADRNVRTIISEVQGGHEASATILRHCAAYAREYPAFYVLQSGFCLAWLLGESEAVPPLYRGEAEFLRRHAVHFCGAEAWLDFARTCGLAFGMRIHGTMAPLQAGVPSLLIEHDTRTSGLAATMGIPSLSTADFLGASRADLMARIAEVMGAYDARRRVLAERMRDHVEANGLTLTPTFQAAMLENAHPA